MGVLLPSDRTFVVRADVHVDELLRRLQRAVTPRRPSFLTSSVEPFAGEVTGTSFDIQSAPARGHFYPGGVRLTGVVVPEGKGTRVEATVRIRRWGGLLVLAAWILPAFAIAFAERRSGVGVGMLTADLAFGAFMWWWFRSSFRREMAKLTHLLWLTLGISPPGARPHRPSGGAP